MPAAMIADTTNNPFIKSLASSNRTTRDRALESLRTYLHRSTPFSELELLKLWKGLFFCMWMSDKPLNQQRLARGLAALVDALQGRENVLGWLRAFWRTMAREWGGIDALRMDKFLYLGFEWVRGAGGEEWKDEGVMEEYLEVLEEVPLNVGDGKIPNGLRYHVVDIYVDELDKVDVGRNAPLDTILTPLRTLGNESLTKAVRKRVQEALKDERLDDWANAAGSDAESKDAEDEGVPDGAAATKGADSEDDKEFGGFED
ncbi:uncharacterized protein LTR77_006828 [Saxophila tyrrhenica]|uniref:Uncharacterized protein n=1 Tax=Saxophila tyrrhenica TaxID=1690608 RepID=A0AAV9P6A9_9PEZI|nr:hypothetical protein LTR77_006828 [Saxophila tyrrhenica]